MEGVGWEGDWVMAVEVEGGLRVALFEASPYARLPASSCPEWGAGPWDLQAFPSEPLDTSVAPPWPACPPGGPGFL